MSRIGAVVLLRSPPAKGMPASTFDVIKANSGSLGDAVVLVSATATCRAPDSTPPDLTPFNSDFEAVMNALRPRPASSG